MYDISIKIKNYKCFIEESGFDTIKRVNLIIGKNNVGKSALLDVIEHVAEKKYEFEKSDRRDDQSPEIIFKKKLENIEIIKTFKTNDLVNILGSKSLDFGKKLIGREISWTKKSPSHCEIISCEDQDLPSRLIEANYDIQLLANIPIPLEGKIFKRLLAEREVSPEVFDNEILIKPNGSGITNAIQCFISKVGLQRELIEVKLLKAINEIFANDANFTRIVSQLDNNKWEIYLEEKYKGRVALSKSGSGLKTVITVLAFLFIIPRIENKSLSEYIFAFEELENNIHPALLRRLNNYIYRLSIDQKFIYFLTTHSNILIDQFSKQEDAQIIHITQKDGWANSETVQTYLQKGNIFDDLDVRASDLLQANGVIWVEGPSDRLYLNKWIDLWSNGQLKEGVHYQIIFYGGRLLSHLSADDPDIELVKIAILHNNRNAIILIDSDKKEKQSSLNSTKERILNEFKNINAVSWVTRGREIENYIPIQIVNEFVKPKIIETINEYESFFILLDKLENGLGVKYSVKKTLLAEKLIPFMTKENMSSVLDLDEKMVEICKRIMYWNKLSSVDIQIDNK